MTVPSTSPTSSPLWLVTNEPSLHDLVGYLTDMRRRIEAAPDAEHRLSFSRKELTEVRAAFARMILFGERKLHRLCSLLCDSFFPRRFELESVVVARVDTTGERFVLSRLLAPDELDSRTDLDLGTREVAKLRYHDGRSFQPAQLVANFVEYQPFETTPHGIFKLGSRIKAEEEIWNKVADEIFDLDGLVQRDKKLKKLSRYVKDVFGLKIVAVDRRRVRKLHDALAGLHFDDEFLTNHGIPATASTRTLQFVEVKDYLAEGEKKSGWSAMKSVVGWWGGTFEIQVQPLRNYLRERERLTRESHSGFKARRESLRDEVAQAVPLFGFYRDVLRWLFLTPEEAAPEFHNVRVSIRD
jgi:hypothetical protein